MLSAGYTDHPYVTRLMTTTAALSTSPHISSPEPITMEDSRRKTAELYRKGEVALTVLRSRHNHITEK